MDRDIVLYVYHTSKLLKLDYIRNITSTKYSAEGSEAYRRVKRRVGNRQEPDSIQHQVARIPPTEFDHKRVRPAVGARTPHERDGVGSEREWWLPGEPAGGRAELVHVFCEQERERAHDAEARRLSRRGGRRGASGGVARSPHLEEAREALLAVPRAHEQHTPR